MTESILEFKKWLLSKGMYHPLNKSFESQEISGLEVKNIKAFMNAEIDEILLFTIGTEIKEETYQKLSSQSFVDNRFPATEMRDHTHSYRILKGQSPVMFCCKPSKPRNPMIMILEKDLLEVLTTVDFI